MVSDDIALLKLTIESIAETDEEKIKCYLFRTDNLLFLDTCFITHQNCLENVSYSYEILEELCGGTDLKHVLFVVTELVLYEMRDKDKGINEKSFSYLKGLSEYGFTIVLVKEENILNMVSPYISKSAKEWNYLFWDKLNNSKPYLKRIMCMADACRYEDKFDSNTFIHNFLCDIKETKKSKDSLAEELIFVYMLFLLELIGNSSRKHIYFLSDDYPAITKLQKALNITNKNQSGNYEAISSFSLAQEMVRCEKITSVSKVEAFLIKTMSEPFHVLINKQPPYQPTEAIVSAHEVADYVVNKRMQVIWKGKG